MNAEDNKRKTSLFRGIYFWFKGLFRKKPTEQRFTIAAPKPRVEKARPFSYTRWQHQRKMRRLAQARGSRGIRDFGMWSRIKPLYLQGREHKILGKINHNKRVRRSWQIQQWMIARRPVQTAPPVEHPTT